MRSIHGSMLSCEERRSVLRQRERKFNWPTCTRKTREKCSSAAGWTCSGRCTIQRTECCSAPQGSSRPMAMHERVPLANTAVLVAFEISLRATKLSARFAPVFLLWYTPADVSGWPYYSAVAACPIVVLALRHMRALKRKLRFISEISILSLFMYYSTKAVQMPICLVLYYFLFGQEHRAFSPN